MDTIREYLWETIKKIEREWLGSEIQKLEIAGGLVPFPLTCTLLFWKFNCVLPL